MKNTRHRCSQIRGLRRRRRSRQHRQRLVAPRVEVGEPGVGGALVMPPVPAPARARSEAVLEPQGEVVATASCRRRRNGGSSSRSGPGPRRRRACERWQKTCMKKRPPGRSQSCTRANSARQLRMCSNISTDTTRSKRRRGSEIVHVGGNDVDVRQARGARASRLDPGALRVRIGNGGDAAAPDSARPSTASASPSRSQFKDALSVARPARSAVTASARASASARSAMPSGHQAQLYLRCVPSTRPKNSAGTS